MGNTKKKPVSRVIIWTIVGVATVGLVGARFLGHQPFTGTEVKPTTGDITTYCSFSGSVEAKNRQSIFAERAMQIKDINVEEGQKVKKDDVLMTTVNGEQIKAKIDGEVAKISAESNAQLMPGSNLMDIVDYSDLQLKVQVDEYDLSAIAKGKNATVTIHSLDKDVKGKIIDVSREGTYLNWRTDH